MPPFTTEEFRRRLVAKLDELEATDEARLAKGLGAWWRRMLAEGLPAAADPVEPGVAFPGCGAGFAGAGGEDGPGAGDGDVFSSGD